MRRVEIVLEDDVAHRLEVMAAIDDVRLADGVERLLTHLVRNYEEQKETP